MRKFITFEGGEGSGKSSQSKLLSKSLSLINETNLLTREPGGTPFSEKLRKMLVINNDYNLLPETELLIIYAARVEHLEKRIIPTLKKKTVICDRYYHSTYCYQIFAKGVPEVKLKLLHKNFASNFMPDLTFFLDLSPKIGVERSLRKKQNETRFEKKNMHFHNKIRKAFLNLAKNNKKIFKVDASCSKSLIHRKIVNHLNCKSFFKKQIPYSL